GLRSKVSSWLGPPHIQKRMTDVGGDGAAPLAATISARLSPPSASVPTRRNSRRDTGPGQRDGSMRSPLWIITNKIPPFPKHATRRRMALPVFCECAVICYTLLRRLRVTPQGMRLMGKRLTSTKARTRGSRRGAGRHALEERFWHIEQRLSAVTGQS